MSTWIVFLIVIVPFLALLGWIASTDAVIRIPPGRVGLLLISGRATDTVVEPGLHWVPRLRKRMVAEYPALELSFRALPDDSGDESSELERTGPALRVVLGDRAQATIGYTVRFRLDLERLRTVHERFGPEGVWTAVRDMSARSVRMRLAEPSVAVDDLFGEQWNALQEQIGAAVAESLDVDGLVVTMFAVGDVDLGRTGDVIQSTVRARLELDREEAESAVRTLRARLDSELEPYLATMPEAALRYREVDALRDLAHAQSDRVIPVQRRRAITVTNAEATEAPAAEPSDES